MNKIVLLVPDKILEDRELSNTAKLILAISYTYKVKEMKISLTNKEVAEFLNITANTIGVHQKRLETLGYKAIKNNKYVLTEEKAQQLKSKSALRIPNEIYSTKLNPGAKLLWGMGNSLSNKGERDSFASRKYYSKSLGCHEDSITNWLNDLERYEFITDRRVISGKNSKQVFFRTVNFSTTSNTGVKLSNKEKRDIWVELVGSISYLERSIITNKGVSEFVKEVYTGVITSENPKSIAKVILDNINSIEGTEYLDLLRCYLRDSLESI